VTGEFFDDQAGGGQDSLVADSPYWIRNDFVEDDDDND
jgi:hypothetical protein